ncbi:MAG: type II secretion system protein [Gammaproteobacteria bacterium]|nr:type II secretion system protein [Gammaproteobacteria bacterium]
MIKNLWAKRHAVTAQFNQIDAAQINDSELKGKFLKLKAKQAGFTLLELLVVVAILAAIAGTASIALQDTDARASAAAHVTMMDELNKGIRTFRVLNKNVLPTGFDSILQTPLSDGSDLASAALLSVAAIEDVAVTTLPVTVAAVMAAGGINSLQYAGLDQTPEGSVVTCIDLEAVIASRANAVVAGNIFMSPAANGCGYTVSFDEDGQIVGGTADSTTQVAIWNGGYERVMGGSGQGFDAAAYAGDDRPALMAVGLGPSSNLFNANDLGGMTTVPVYRHVSGTQYNRFVALFNIGTLSSDGATITANDQVSLTAIVDGAGDTKEEELGEWDGTRNTI